jgi:ribonucleoside-diphosphate reductase alpha chain
MSNSEAHKDNYLKETSKNGNKGLKIEKVFTSNNKDVFSMFEYDYRKSIIREPDGKVVFEVNNIEVPKDWSQVATDILAQKYFRKTGVPILDEDNNPIKDEKGNIKTGSETSIKQVVKRLASCWRHWGEKYHYFATKKDADNFESEISYMLLNQMAAPNSPQWFNTGLAHSYGIRGKPQGHYYVEPESGKLKQSEDAYTRPQPHACFIQTVEDDLVNYGGIFDLMTKEARIFKYGSGTGTNFSALRSKGEPLSGGGVTSGLMSFLKIYDRAAGAIKSGGTTRRAAKMVIVNVDHPDIESFINWKMLEEQKIASMVSGSKICSEYLNKILKSASVKGINPEENPELKKLIYKATKNNVPLNYIDRVLKLAKEGKTEIDFPIYDTGFESEAYETVSGQNSNNSVRVTNEFMTAVEKKSDWKLINRLDKTVARSVKADKLWDKISYAAWSCADPGLQYDTTINEWHTCPQDGRINGSNPCSEYMFLDDSACNLASINVKKFYNEETRRINIEDFRHAARLWTIVLEISVLMAQFPGKEIALRSYDFRTLGLGYANIGSLLMTMGIPYDSKKALAIVGAVSAIMTGEAYATSAEMAAIHGPFRGYAKNKADMLRVIRNHRRAAYNSPPDEYEGLSIKPHGINQHKLDKYLRDVAKETWDRALQLGEKYGYRNAQVSVIAPTGTIGLVMDCDTTGIEPDFALVKFKKLSGGGYFKIVNQSVPKALENLGYNPVEIREIKNYMIGYGTLEDCPEINRNTLKEKGFSDALIDKLEKVIEQAFELKFAFNRWTLGEDFCKNTLKISEDKLNDPDTNLLLEIGFTKSQYEKANDYVSGTMTIEDAPHLNKKHYPIFDCASKCGKKGKRSIDYMAHVRMMAAAQPFISGAISKTVNMEASSTTGDIKNVYMSAWKYMVKAIALYRDTSKLSQPLNISSDMEYPDLFDFNSMEDIDETISAEDIHRTVIARGEKRELPFRRPGGFTQKARIGGHNIYLRTGEYDDGSLGEIFIDMYKEGAPYRSLLNAFAISISIALQHGTPLERLVDAFIFARFEPSGIVQGDPYVKNCTSILDYVFRSLAIEYLGRSDLAHIKPGNKKLEIKKNKKDKNKVIENPANGEKIVIDPVIRVVEKDLGKIKDARMKGYTGDQCTNCGSMRVRQNGTCAVCEDCGTTTGCS